MHVSKWAGHHPGTKARFPRGLARILGDKAEDKVRYLSSPCLLHPSKLGCVCAGFECAHSNCDPFLSVVSHFSPSLAFTYFSYLSVVSALPLFCVFPPPSLNGFSLYFSILHFSHLGVLEKLVVDLLDHDLPSAPTTLIFLLPLFLLVLPHPCLPGHSPFMVLSTFLLLISTKCDRISSFCAVTLLWR